VKAVHQPKPPAIEGSHRWTFLTNHAHVLIQLQAEPGLVLREVANRVGITERAVQRIVQELEEEGFLERQRVGRKNEYRVILNKPLRHPIEAHCKIGDLVSLVTGKPPQRRSTQ
jgi:DNA-binding HxlR family transcriptional regulator